MITSQPDIGLTVGSLQVGLCDCFAFSVVFVQGARGTQFFNQVLCQPNVTHFRGPRAEALQRDHLGKIARPRRGIECLNLFLYLGKTKPKTHMVTPCHSLLHFPSFSFLSFNLSFYLHMLLVSSKTWTPLLS